MGSAFKKAVTRPLPPGSEFIVRQEVRLARWRDGKGKIRTAPVTTWGDGTDRIRDESSTYFARYRDHIGVVIETPTGCRDETTARQILAELERRAERVRAGLLTPAEDRIADHLATPIADHVNAFIESMESRGVIAMHRENTRRHLECLMRDCGFARLVDLKRESLERWLATETQKGRSARSRNAHRTALVSFCNWCVAVGRLSTNPFKGVPRANEAADPRRRRRAMTEAELVRLLDVARRRPLLDALTVCRGKRKGGAYADVRPEVRERLEAVGRERALINKTLVLTGLRKNELASLSVAQLRFDGPVPHVELDAADEKSREGNGVVVRADLAGDLRHWLDDKLAALQADTIRRGAPIPAPSSGGSTRLRRAERSGADLRPRLEARRHPEVRRSRADARLACTQDDLRHALEQGGRSATDGTIRHAALRPKPDGERLHRSQSTRRAWGSRSPAEPATRQWTEPHAGASQSNRDRVL
jgi:integrase